MKTKGTALSSQHLPLKTFQISTCLPPVLRERSSWVERRQDCDLEDSGPLRFLPFLSRFPWSSHWPPWGCFLTFKEASRGLPWWLSGKESTCRYRKHGFNLWSGKMPNTVEQLSPHIITTEPVCNSPWAATPEAHMSPCSTTSEATTVRRPCTATGKQPPLAAPTESPHATAKTQHSHRQTNTTLKRDY